MLDPDPKHAPSPTAARPEAQPEAATGAAPAPAPDARLFAALAVPAAERVEAAAGALRAALRADLVAVVCITTDRRLRRWALSPAGGADDLPERWLDPQFLDGRRVAIEDVASTTGPVLRLATVWAGPGALEVVPLGGASSGGALGCVLVGRALRLSSDEVATLEAFVAALAALVAAEQALSEARDQYARLMEQSPDGIFVLDPQLRFVAVNAEVCELLGLERDALEGEHVRAVLAPESPPLPRLERPGERVRTEQRIVRRDGRQVDVEANVSMLDNGLVQGIARDIGHRRRIEQQLKAHLHLLAAIRDVQSEYIGDGMPQVPFRRFLHHLLELSGARTGFVCEVQRKARGSDAVRWAVRAGDDELERSDAPREASPRDQDRLEALLARFEREPIVHADLDELPLELAGERAERVRERGPYLVVPMRDHQRLVGIAGFAASELGAGLAPLALEDHLRPFLDSFANIIAAFHTSQAHKAAEAEAARLAYLLDQASNEILVFDGRTLCFVQANDRARRNLGFDAAALSQITPLSLLPQIGANHFDSMLEILRRHDQEQVSFETVVRRRDNTVYPVDVSLQIATPDDDDGGETVFVAIMQDISARKQAEARATYLVHHDRLTGLPNRLGFIDRLESVLAQARHDGSHVAVLFLDLDRFQIINDTLGHDAGDQLLKLVTQRLLPSLRPGDTLARLGGDEFTIILPEIEPIEEVALVTQSLLEAFADPFDLGERELFTSASIGVTLFPADATDIGGLLKHADTALGHAKRSGRNTYAFFTAEMNARAIERLALENELRRALERDELVVHYQPQIDLRTGRITAVEALLRWQHPRLGLVSPAAFIPLAEETGLIVALGEWVLRTACQQVHAWHLRGHRHLRVAVNLSARQMVQTILPGLHATLVDTGIDPRCVELELTESLLMEDNPASMAALHELQALGISFSIDDFGTGYSNLGYLKQLPIDTLKIDRSFVRDVMRDPDDAAIAKAIIAMAHGLGIRVIAEGVETRAQLDFLVAHRCDAFQGYYFSPALPAEHLGRLLDEGRGLSDLAEDL